MTETIFVPCEGVTWKNCFVTVFIVPGKRIGIVTGRDPGVFDSAIQHVLKSKGYTAAFLGV